MEMHGVNRVDIVPSFLQLSGKVERHGEPAVREEDIPSRVWLFTRVAVRVRRRHAEYELLDDQLLTDSNISSGIVWTVP